MSTKDQQTLAKAIITQAIRDLRSRTAHRRAEARRWLRPTPALLTWATLADLRASTVIEAARRGAR